MFQADGAWMDSSIKAGPAGTADGNFQFAEIAHLFGSMAGKIEEKYKKYTQNKSMDFYFTRRQEDMPWFSLVGIIANGRTIEDFTQTQQAYFQPHEAFLIGDGAEYTPKESGYFYAYANDAWNFYSNNRGRVRLKVGISSRFID